MCTKIGVDLLHTSLYTITELESHILTSHIPNRLLSKFITDLPNINQNVSEPAFLPTISLISIKSYLQSVAHILGVLRELSFYREKLPVTNLSEETSGHLKFFVIFFLFMEIYYSFDSSKISSDIFWARGKFEFLAAAESYIFHPELYPIVSKRYCSPKPNMFTLFNE